MEQERCPQIQFDPSEIDDRMAAIRMSRRGYGSTACAIPTPVIIKGEPCLATIRGCLIDLNTGILRVYLWAVIQAPDLQEREYPLAYGFALEAQNGAWRPGPMLITLLNTDQNWRHETPSYDWLSYGTYHTWD